MSFLEPIDLPKPTAGPAFMVGAISPLWGYFSAAAMGGVAYWWMTRWTQAVNLEALFGAAARVAETGQALTTKALETAAEVAPPLGGEAAPISPVVAVAEPPVAATEPLVEPPTPAPEPAITAPAEPASFAEPGLTQKRKAAAQPPAPTPDA